MKQTSEVVKRIKEPFVGNRCVQYMFSYKSALTLINEEGILYHANANTSHTINRYLEDERRRQFPYFNIPIHYQKEGVFKTKVFTNQLLDFEEPCLSIHDGSVSEVFAVKDHDEALLINKRMDQEEHTEYMTFAQLESFLSPHSNEEHMYCVYLDGLLPFGDDCLLPSLEEIYTFIKNEMEIRVRDLKEYQQNHKDKFSRYLQGNLWFLDYIEQNIKEPDFSSVDFNVKIGNHSTLIIVRVNNGSFSIQGVDIEFVKEHFFRVKITDFLVNKYTLEQLKYVPKIMSMKEPKISLRLNPGVSKQDIKEAKEMMQKLILKNERNRDV